MAVMSVGRLMLMLNMVIRRLYGLVGKVLRIVDLAIEIEIEVLQEREKRRRKNERGVHGWIAGW